MFCLPIQFCLSAVRVPWFWFSDVVLSMRSFRVLRCLLYWCIRLAYPWNSRISFYFVDWLAFLDLRPLYFFSISLCLKHVKIWSPFPSFWMKTLISAIDEGRFICWEQVLAPFAGIQLNSHGGLCECFQSPNMWFGFVLTYFLLSFSCFLHMILLCHDYFCLGQVLLNWFLWRNWIVVEC